MTERCPVTVVATTAPAAVTPNAGSEAITAASGKARRGQGVNRTRFELEIRDAVPIVIAA